MGSNSFGSLKKLMKILIAEDNKIPRKILIDHLNRWNYEVVVTEDGEQAWNVLKEENAPSLAILDWVMPKMEGIEVCRKLRALNKKTFTYVILLTANERKEDIVEGLNAGADDYITKPFNSNELQSRVNAGVRIVKLEEELHTKIDELEEAFKNINTLERIIPMCAWCKKIRDDSNFWLQVEDYISSHSDSEFTHSICPGCLDDYCKENDLEVKDIFNKKREKVTS